MILIHPTINTPQAVKTLEALTGLTVLATGQLVAA